MAGADRVPREASVGVGRIVDRRGTRARHVGVQRRRRQREERAEHENAVDGARRGGGREPAHARAARELQQHRLGLVIRVVRGQQRGTAMRVAQPDQRGVAQPARLALDGPGARVDPHARVIERDAEHGGLVPAVHEPGIGIGGEAVMDVERERRERAVACERGRGVQQRGGVLAAAVRDGHARLRRRRESRDAQGLADGGDGIGCHVTPGARSP